MTLDPESTLDRPNLVYHEAQDRMALLPNYYGWIAARFARFLPRGTILELGCGAGFVLRHYVAKVEHVVAVDVNDALLERLGREYPRQRVEPRRVDLRGDWHEIADVQADAVIALDVLEHFQDDAAFVRKLGARLSPRGRAIVKVPAQSALYGPMDQASGHYRRYDAAPLRELFEREGFATLCVRPMNPAGAWGYRRKRAESTNYSKSISPGKLKVINALMPALALLDHVPGLKGLSLVGVFERR
ncbi:MAG: class I SAM-dependent methyltransferase [Planctomycetes bacterium]|nr:class I SAM-dependent methyltransferase [Planctomycetota bacterium]